MVSHQMYKIYNSIMLNTKDNQVSREVINSCTSWERSPAFIFSHLDQFFYLFISYYHYKLIIRLQLLRF